MTFRPLAVGLVLALAFGCDDGSDPAAESSAGAGADRDSAAESVDPRDGSTPDAGDGEDDGECAALGGSYQATYTAQSGTCGDLTAPARISVDAAAMGVSTLIERFAASTVTTDVVVRGCAVRVSQTVADDQGRMVLRIAAEELSIDGDGLVTGTAMVTRFDESGAVSCSGVYTVELRSSSTVIGGTRDGGGADSGAPASLPEDVQTKVEYDCSQTVMCSAQQGVQLPPDPLANCIANTSRLLAENAGRLAAFLENFAACEPFVICDYVNCAQAQR